jgi:hypothetical protein
MTANPLLMNAIFALDAYNEDSAGDDAENGGTRS